MITLVPYLEMNLKKNFGGISKIKSHILMGLFIPQMSPRTARYAASVKCSSCVVQVAKPAPGN